MRKKIRKLPVASATKAPEWEYFVHKIKCLKCCLHFVIYSWNEKLALVDICPECHQSLVDGKIVWKSERRRGFIFEELKI